MKNTVLVLLNMLEDEFRDYKDVRLFPVFPSSTKRSIDLVQDYDPESSNIHKTSGVNVLALNKEYFFSADWLAQKDYKEIYRQIEKVRQASV